MSKQVKPPSEQCLQVIEQLLAIETTDLHEALTQAAQLTAQALQAEKADIFFYEPEHQTLVALGTSQTPLGRLQQALGLDRFPLANGGRSVSVFRTGISYRNGQVQDDPEELLGIKQGLHIRSALIVPLMIGEERRGIVQVNSTQPEAFTEQDQRLLEGVAHWMGMVVQRAELLQQVTHSAAEQARRGTAETLVTVFAHDIRNLLTPLQGRLDMLQRRAQREQRERDLADLAAVKLALCRFERLITDLLDTARLSQGLLTLTCQPLELASLVQEAALPLQTPFVQIEVQVPASIIVWVDAARMQQALENVLANAVKYAPKGSTVHVQAGEQPQEGRVLLSVTDQGPGIPEELRPHLFEPFHAGKGSTGLGLGLSLAAQIVAAQGGVLSLDETYQHGARFVFSLPTASQTQSRTPA